MTHNIRPWLREIPCPEGGNNEVLLPETLEDLRGKTADELRQIVEVVDAHLKALHQDEDTGALRDLSNDEQRAFDIGVEIRNRAIDKIEEHMRVSQIFEKRPKSVERVYNNIRHGLADEASDVRRLTNYEARDRALRVLDSKSNNNHLRAYELDHVERQIRKNHDVARRVIVTENEAYREAWLKLVTQPNAAALLTDEERTAIRAWEEYRAMSEGVAASGGYGIPVFIDPSIILTAQGSTNPFLQLARSVDINTNQWKGVSSAGVSWSFDAEGSAVSDDSPSLAQPVVTVFMARGFIPFSIELGMDYPSFADEMQTLLAAGYDELLVQKFTAGSGSGEPMGIATALLADTTARVAMTTSASLAAGDVYNTWKALPQRFRRNANWLMNVGMNNAIRELGAANVYHAVTVTLAEDAADKLFNKDVYESPYMSDYTTATNTVVAVVGDFSNYVIARNGGMSVELIPNLVDVTNNRPTGQRGWFAYSRIGGGPASDNAFKALTTT